MRKLKIYILIFPLLVSLFSCSTDENETNIDLYIDLSLFDQKGNDLLTPDAEKGVDSSQIEVFYKEDGKFIEAHKSKYPQRGYSLLPPDVGFDKYTVRLFVSSIIESEDKSVTIIKWNEQESDTITTQIYKGENSEIGIEYWINGKIPDWIDRGHKIAKIIKTR